MVKHIEEDGEERKKMMKLRNWTRKVEKKCFIYAKNIDI